MPRTSTTVSELFDDYDDSTDIAPSPTSAPFLRLRQHRLSLHFNVFSVQSQMDLKAPERLVVGYTRTLMGFLVFNSEPRHIGMIGLGGGSMQKHCYRHLPNSLISVAEISPEVISLRTRFCIPDDDHRFTVSCEDGADFVKRHQNEFDVLVVDGFDIGGQPPQLCSQDFYEDCWTALTPEGILAVNVCESRDSILISRMRRIFRQRVLVVAGDRGGNTVAFAAKGSALGQTREEFAANRRSIEVMAASL